MRAVSTMGRLLVRIFSTLIDLERASVFSLPSAGIAHPARAYRIKRQMCLNSRRAHTSVPPALADDHPTSSLTGARHPKS